MASRYMVGSRTLTEMKEFAGLSARAQRYIRRALDIAFDRRDALAHGDRLDDRHQRLWDALVSHQFQVLVCRVEAVQRSRRAAKI